MLSAGAACAADADNSTDGEVIGVGEKSYTDLANLIDSSPSSKIEINDDYKFDLEKDKMSAITVEFKKNIVFEGNNHAIDANGSAGLFKFRNSTVTIKNLVIRNCNSSAIVATNSAITVNNVTFENNFDAGDGAAISALKSTVSSRDDTFTNNYANKGGAIYLEDSTLEATGDLFVSEIPLRWGFIYGQTSGIAVDGCVFANATSKYATAIFNDETTSIKRSKFINLHANASGGAIGVKGENAEKANVIVLIQDCQFVNVSAARDGGAIFADIPGTGSYKGKVIINKTDFTDCAAEYGGALLQLGGSLDIINSHFENNRAYFSGGAVYVSDSLADIKTSEFKNSNALGDGGAIYVDWGHLKSNKNTFVKNTAVEGGAIFLYDSVYEITSSTFSGNGEAICSYFDNDGSYQKNNNLGTDKVVLNKKYYGTDVYFEGKPIVLNPLKIQGSASDSYFNLAKQGLVTPVKDQGNMGSCWAFGTAAAMESAFLIATNITLDISENNIHSAALRYSRYGSTEVYEGATYYEGAGYMLGWLGVVSTVNDEYDQLGKVSSIIFEEDAYHALDALFVKVSDRQAIKQALTKYGALAFFMYGEASEKYYNEKTYGLYYNGEVKGNHIVAVVGWDDNYSRNNFVSTPPGDGAWICKNSWGSDWGDEGYFYMSYYDNSIKVPDSYAVTFVINNTQAYNKLYQYDPLGVVEEPKNCTEFMNVYTAEDTDLIAAIGTYFIGIDRDYTITIYINGSEVYSQSGNAPINGFNTIKLNKYVLVNKNDEFSVKIKAPKAWVVEDSRILFEEEKSFIIQGKQTIDMWDYGGVASLKVYTVKNPYDVENYKQYYDASRIFEMPSNFENAVLTLKQNGKKIASTTVKNGVANFGVVLNSGMYALEIPINGTVVVVNVEILSTVAVDKTINVGYNTKLDVVPTFTDSNAKALSGVTVKYQVDKNKQVSVKTDASGKIKVTLAKGTSIGTHKIVFTNTATKEVATVTVKVVSRFADNKDINMYYYDGTKYSVRIMGNNGKHVGAGQTVSIQIGKKTYKVKTDKYGYVTMKIPDEFTPATYKITVTYAGQTVKNTLKVKQVLTSKKTVTVKKSAKKLVLKATLKGKNVLKNKNVTFKVNGKIYKAKTNSKGIAKVTIKKSAIKKLKAGKKYSVMVTYLKDTIKTTLKVKR